MAPFGAQPFGLGPFFPGTVLHFAHVQSVRYAQCALFREKMAASDGFSIVLTGPKERSEKVQIKAAKRWNGGSISSFANTEL